MFLHNGKMHEGSLGMPRSELGRVQEDGKVQRKAVRLPWSVYIKESKCIFVCIDSNIPNQIFTNLVS